uniref:Auxine transporter-like protein 2 n=1 Tax=Rhizophora mucronata TaxID=61149 RepID=A0A2P2M7Z8_RHIMU
MAALRVLVLPESQVNGIG